MLLNNQDCRAFFCSIRGTGFDLTGDPQTTQKFSVSVIFDIAKNYSVFKSVAKKTSYSYGPIMRSRRRYKEDFSTAFDVTSSKISRRWNSEKKCQSGSSGIRHQPGN